MLEVDPLGNGKTVLEYMRGRVGEQDRGRQDEAYGQGQMETDVG